MPKQDALKVDISPNAVNTLGEISSLGRTQNPMNNKITPRYANSNSCFQDVAYFLAK